MKTFSPVRYFYPFTRRKKECGKFLLSSFLRKEVKPQQEYRFFVRTKYKYSMRNDGNMEYSRSHKLSYNLNTYIMGFTPDSHAFFFVLNVLIQNVLCMLSVSQRNRPL